MSDKLSEIQGLLEPIAGQDWHGKWRILKALDLCRNKHSDVRLSPEKLAEVCQLQAQSKNRVADCIYSNEDCPICPTKTSVSQFHHHEWDLVTAKCQTCGESLR